MCKIKNYLPGKLFFVSTVEKFQITEYIKECGSIFARIWGGYFLNLPTVGMCVKGDGH